MEFTTKEVIAAILPTIPTADLILELERRSKCSSCANNDSGERCDCIWYCRYDNYKPRPTTEPLPDQTKGEGL